MTTLKLKVVAVAAAAALVWLGSTSVAEAQWGYRGGPGVRVYSSGFGPGFYPVRPRVVYPRAAYYGPTVVQSGYYSYPAGVYVAPRVVPVPPVVYPSYRPVIVGPGWGPGYGPAYGPGVSLRIGF